MILKKEKQKLANPPLPTHASTTPQKRKKKTQELPPPIPRTQKGKQLLATPQTKTTKYKKHFGNGFFFVHDITSREVG